MVAEHCSWCGAEVEADDGYRAYEPAGERRAVFCRLEHVVPWGIKGAFWEAGALDDPHLTESGSFTCSQCGTDLDPEVHVVLVRHRGEHRIADHFCGVDHLVDWAKAGGRWQ
ncbi:MAG TPA: hypothetical protein VIL04_01660 [Solirubrobacterales bacterium]|jgi:hypothetical protein